jgi:hypothetical protein
MYAILTSRSIVVRVTAVLVMVQAIYLKYFVWHDFVTQTSGILLGSLAAFMVSKLTIKKSEGLGYNWSAIASRWTPDSEFELQLSEADDDWRGTQIGFRLTENDGVTEVSFQHLGWPEANEHYQISCFCWAMYLRLLKRYVEFGEVVPYEVASMSREAPLNNRTKDLSNQVTSNT